MTDDELADIDHELHDLKALIFRDGHFISPTNEAEAETQARRRERIGQLSARKHRILQEQAAQEWARLLAELRQQLQAHTP